LAKRERRVTGENRDDAQRQVSKTTAAGDYLRSRVIKRSLVVGGHKTSVSLEETFWRELRAIAQARRLTLSQLVGTIDAARAHSNLSSAIRVFVFECHRARSQAEAKRDDISR